MKQKTKEILILSGYVFAVMLACGYLITFFTAYWNGLTTGQYWTIVNIGFYGEQHIEMIMFSFILVIILYSFYHKINQFSIKYNINKEPHIKSKAGQISFLATIGVLTTIGLCLLILSILNG